MLIHSVYFWLRPDLSAAEQSGFAQSVAALVALPSVRSGWVGTPSATERPVIDSSYSFGLVLAFDDLQGHDEYQEHPDHERFAAENARLWTRAQVYDVDA